MKYDGFYNKAWKFTKKAWKITKKVLNHKRFYNPVWTLFITALGAFIVFIVFRYSQTAWLFFCAIWNDRSPIQSEQTLQLAIGLLTLLVTIIAIFTGVIILLTRRDWRKFKEEQEPIIKELKKETEEINWLDKLRESMKESPHLDSGNAKEAIDSIKEHYFKRDKYNEAWEYFGVARWYENDKRYEKDKRYNYAICYYKKADDVDLDETDSKAKELRKHIKQSLGLHYFYRGKYREENRENEKAIKDYEAAIPHYDWVIKYDPQFAMAYLNKAVTLIQLGKIEGDKTGLYHDANYCFKEAIECLKKIEDNYDHFYDKARAHALLNQRDEAIESLRRSFTLAERDLGKLYHYLERDSEDFKNVKEEEEFKVLVK